MTEESNPQSSRSLHEHMKSRGGTSTKDRRTSSSRSNDSTSSRPRRPPRSTSGGTHDDPTVTSQGSNERRHRTDDRSTTSHGSSSRSKVSRSTGSGGGGERSTSKSSPSTGTSSSRRSKRSTPTKVSAGSGTSSDDDEELPTQDTPDFAAFGDSNFGGEAFSSPSPFMDGPGIGSTTSTDFEAAFGTFPTDFAPTSISTLPDDTFDLPSFGGGGGGGSSMAFASATFASFDTSPITSPPIPDQDLESPRIQLEQPRPILVQKSPPTAHPVANPLSGNIICIRQSPQWQIIEWNPNTQSQVMSTPLFSLDLQKKILQKYKTVTATAIDNVLTLAVGVHQGQGYTRPRVACLMDVFVEDTNTTDKKREVLRVVAIWQWGYGTTSMIQLQSLLSPPSGSDFSYNPASLLLADSCVFISGASPKGPCVFLSKPTVKETWSANFVGKEAARIASMAVPPTSVHTTDLPKRPWQAPRVAVLAIALTDGSVSVWTYEAATKVSAKNTTETVRRLLYPLCRLETKLLRNVTSIDWESNTSKDSANKEVGYCTHLEWVSPRISAHNQLWMLAAAFQGGVCLYHVALPKVIDTTSTKKGASYISIKEPSEKTQLSQTCTLKPFGMIRWPMVYHHSYLAFCDLGPHLPPSLTVLVTGNQTNLDYARIALVTCPLSMYGFNVNNNKSEDNALWVWHSQEFTQPSPTLPRGLIPCSFGPGIIYYSDSHLQLLTLKQPWYAAAHNTSRLVRGGIGSIPAGLTTAGGTYSSDCTNERGNSHKDGIWHIFTTLQCERKKNDEYLEWTMPMRRHWLIQTMIGDSKEAGAVALSGGGGSGDEDAWSGGTTSKVICELGGLGPLSLMTPLRLVRSNGMGAVVFQNLLSTKKRKTLIAIVDKEESSSTGDDDGSNNKKSSIVQVLEGRDLVFLPHTMDPIQFLLLSPNGGSISLYARNKDDSHWSEQKESARRPIVGFDENVAMEYVDCQRVIRIDFQNRVGLIAVGHKHSSNLSCIIASKLVEATQDLDWTKVLPNIQNDAILWLEEHEQVKDILPLPSEQKTQGGIAVTTSHRIMILAPTSLKVLSSVAIRTSPSSLIPMGSYTVAYSSHDDYKLRYLSGVPGSFGSSGLIATFPLPQYDYNPHWILAIRPDRIVYTSCHMGTRLVERGQDSHLFLMPTATTRPALLLEPMIANAIATGSSQTGSQPYFRTIIEKFGRKVATMTHGENEGIGNHGAGMTPRVFELLEYYNLKAAASWLLTGTTRFDRSANSRLLPSWMPISAKVKGAFNADTHLHVIANGDQYFSEYIKSPDNNMTATLPRPSDPSTFMCQYFAAEALRKGNALDALKMLDIVGTENSDAMLLQLVLAMQIDPSKDVTTILNALCQSDTQLGKATSSSSVASLAALAAQLKQGKATAEDDFTKQWMRPLAPSIQRGRKINRIRPRIIGESAFESIGASQRLEDKLFSTETNESRLVWNEGPNREKENLLLLDHIQEWFGRRRPLILGKEGAKNAEDRGASTLADILAQPDDDDSFGGGDGEADTEDGWVDGVGEGQKDEDKLSAYFRFSEGEDEDNSWREEGFTDLSKYEVKATLVNCKDTAKLQESTSNVDEGDSGKVKPIFDLVFEQGGIGEARALAIPAPRGGSLDIGMMHGPDHTSRQKCSIEFWFWVPEKVKNEIILVRRTFGTSANDLDNVCKASEQKSALWELAVSSKGEIEFRTAGGGRVNSSPNTGAAESEGSSSTIQFGKWNHVCVTMKQESMTTSIVNILVKGNSVCSKTLDFRPPNYELDEFAGASGLDSLLEKSHLLLALDHPATFRLTELRVWATERDDDDIRTMMSEYLEAAEQKRKFRVKIKKKGGEGAKLGLASPKAMISPRGSGLAAPGGGLAPPKLAIGRPKGALSPPKGALAPPEESDKPSRKGGLLAPPKGTDDETPKVASPKDDSGFGVFGEAAPVETPTAAFGADAFGGFGSMDVSPQAAGTFDSAFGGPSAFNDLEQVATEDVEPEESYDEGLEISPLWDSAIPLSEQVRSSAAAALIRGPPATRHFGGNRGGLPDYRELGRLGVGAISICGSEKTIVWRDDQVPPGLTYPIGASGAIVSDQMDEEGSEFLCCFLAKDKRMVVFELSTRTVVVELQMTTKLNYWRFLPPEAGEDTLCFMLVTPVGGFHWMPLDESPRPRQVWKRGPELQSKKIVCYEEGGTNGMDGADMLSKCGMLLVTNAATGGRLEAWLVPICGDSQAVCASDEILGACLCRPPGVGYEAWMPLLLSVVASDAGDLVVCVSAVIETSEVSIGLTDVMTDALIEQGPYEGVDYEPPTLAMGTWPEVLCCSLGSTIVIIVRRKGLVVAYELADTGLELIAQEHVGHYVVDAVMRYSAVEGGAEIVLLMSDADNPRDGRVGTFCFRTAGA